MTNCAWKCKQEVDRETTSSRQIRAVDWAIKLVSKRLRAFFRRPSWKSHYGHSEACPVDEEISVSGIQREKWVVQLLVPLPRLASYKGAPCGWEVRRQLRSGPRDFPIMNNSNSKIASQIATGSSDWPKLKMKKSASFISRNSHFPIHVSPIRASREPSRMKKAQSTFAILFQFDRKLGVKWRFRCCNNCFSKYVNRIIS